MVTKLSGAFSMKHPAKVLKQEASMVGGVGRVHLEYEGGIVVDMTVSDGGISLDTNANIRVDYDKREFFLDPPTAN